jgi:hypothetical protein
VRHRHGRDGASTDHERFPRLVFGHLEHSVEDLVEWHVGGGHDADREEMVQVAQHLRGARRYDQRQAAPASSVDQLLAQHHQVETVVEVQVAQQHGAQLGREEMPVEGGRRPGTAIEQ